MMHNKVKGQFTGISQSLARRNGTLFEFDIKRWGRKTLLRGICCCIIFLMLLSFKHIDLSGTNRINEEIGFRLQQEITYKDMYQKALLFGEAISNRGSRVLAVLNLEARFTRSLMLPMDGTIAVFFNEEIPASGKVSRGIVIEGEAGQNVLAADDGVVIEEATSKNGGHSLIIKHRGDILTVYKNMGVSKVELNQRVNKGDVIGQSKENLTFEVWNKKDPVDPLEFIDINQSKL